MNQGMEFHSQVCCLTPLHLIGCITESDVKIDWCIHVMSANLSIIKILVLSPLNPRILS